MAGVTLKCKAALIYFDRCGRLRWSKCVQDLCTIGIQWFCTICILALLSTMLSRTIASVGHGSIDAISYHCTAEVPKSSIPINFTIPNRKTLATRCRSTVSKDLIGSLTLTVWLTGRADLCSQVSPKHVESGDNPLSDEIGAIPFLGQSFTREDSWFPNRLATHRTKTWQTWSQVSYSVNEKSWKINNLHMLCSYPV